MWKRWLSFILIALLIARGGFAQEPATKSPEKTNEQDQSFRIITNEVRLPLRAFDAVGRRILDLTAKEVLVIEDGVACPVTSLKQESANVMFLLDLSNNLGVLKSRLLDEETRQKLFTGSGYTTIPRPIARELVEFFLRRLIPRNQISILQYSDRVETLQGWTRNREEAIQNLRAGFRAGLKARFYDALAMAAKGFQNAPPGRRVLVVLTDGLDSASVSSKQSAFEQILASGASVYVLSWTKLLLGEAVKSPNHSSLKRIIEIRRYREQAASAAEDLQTLTVNSGGDYWQPAVVSELMLQKPDVVVDEIDAEYTLSYLSQKDEIKRTAVIPEILIARPGRSVITRRPWGR